MNLLELPCEILLYVAEQCDDPRDILSFACLTRATYNILQDLLYRSCAQQENCIALHYAAKHNKYDVAQRLLRYGANVNSMLKTDTALIVAAVFGSESVIDLLLAQEDINVNARNMQGETAMWRAAYAGCGWAVGRLLLQSDLEIDVPDTFHGFTPFALAVANGNEGIAKALLDTNKININFRDARGRTPLHHAVHSKNKPLLLLLLSRKDVDIQIQDETRCTPLWCATERGNLDAAQLLLMYGADPNKPGFNGITPLNNSIWQRDTEMVKLLLNQPDLEIPRQLVGWAERAQTPLCAAVCVGDANILRMLLCHVTEVNACNYDGYQPLLLAVRKGDSSMVKHLLSHKDIDVNRRGGGRYGYTALHQAAHDGCLSILNILLAHPGIDINAKDEWETTPLWWATKNNHCLVVKRLLAESTLELDGFVELLFPLHHRR